MMKSILGLAALSLLLHLNAFEAHAEVKLGTLLSDGAVLQRDKPVAIWGSATPGEQVTVEFADQKQDGVANAKGSWLIRLAPLAASSQPRELKVRGENEIVLRDVLVGDVWLCSGQSNMNLPLDSTEGGDQEIAAARDPLLRYFEVKSAILEEPSEFADGVWQSCSPDLARRFTAVGFHFAKELRSELGVPVGIIKATLGGSPIEGWMAAESLYDEPAAIPAFDEWQRLEHAYQQRAQQHRQDVSQWEGRRDAAKLSGVEFTEARPTRPWEDSDRNKPGGLYNGFIHPLEPYTLAGILWYQGEGNVPRPAEYKVLFPKMIGHWREAFQQPELPFLFVQLPNYDQHDDLTKESWPRLREAQTAALRLEDVGMAVTIDIGDSVDLHPRNKRDVGRRLSLIALKQVYGRDVQDRGPVLADVQYGASEVRLEFDNANGLVARGNLSDLFTVAGPDRKFFPATARIEGDKVSLSSPQVPRPVAVRMNWINDPQSSLRNSAGLPAAPFRTDKW
ncbi:sialate O-acetylesterase [Aeoliella sp. SH292]|uniref:sialate O-acetylesterase n=1 Tax=Aeoliella sp. SH292 TaxID=3454464 RepID=UPI003F98DB3F